MVLRLRKNIRRNNRGGSIISNFNITTGYKGCPLKENPGVSTMK